VAITEKVFKVRCQRSRS